MSRRAVHPALVGDRSLRAAITAIGIVIPARNEQARLRRCLDAIGAAVRQVRRTEHVPVAIRTVVVLDSCTDRSADIASRYCKVETVVTDFGAVGPARALGTRTLVPRGTASHEDLWLANTDADSTVPVDWLTHMLEQAHRGADLVLGTVTPDDVAPRNLREAWTDRHVIEDDHPHVHAANLGIRASTYLALGGWPQRPTGEDVALVRAAELDTTVRIRRTGAIPVVTSSRLTGRAPQGFAQYLQRLTDHLERPELAGLNTQA